MNYQQTSLWKNSIDNEEYGNTELRNKLRFCSMECSI